MRTAWFYIFLLYVLTSCGNDGQPGGSLDHWNIRNEYDSLGREALERDTGQWTEILEEEGSIVIDMPYASMDNFTGKQLYPCARCFLRTDAAEAFYKGVHALNEKGFVVKVLDCYRPRRVQNLLHEALPDAYYFAGPMKTEFHNNGLSVDLTLMDARGRRLDMGSDYNHFGPASFHEYQEVSDEAKQRRALIMSTLRPLGFQAMKSRWWQYNFRWTNAPSEDIIWYCQ
ncbi:MAG: M15 family metallopeptidase [Saprospiraceae bacterium]|nr:M15 family metallopeptidase [Saprospiraceae bacterium]